MSLVQITKTYLSILPLFIFPFSHAIAVKKYLDFKPILSVIYLFIKT